MCPPIKTQLKELWNGQSGHFDPLESLLTHTNSPRSKYAFHSITPVGLTRLEVLPVCCKAVHYPALTDLALEKPTHPRGLIKPAYNAHVCVWAQSVIIGDAISNWALRERVLRGKSCLKGKNKLQWYLWELHFTLTSINKGFTWNSITAALISNCW